MGPASLLLIPCPPAPVTSCDTSCPPSWVAPPRHSRDSAPPPGPPRHPGPHPLSASPSSSRPVPSRLPPLACRAVPCRMQRSGAGRELPAGRQAAGTAKTPRSGMAVEGRTWGGRQPALSRAPPRSTAALTGDRQWSARGGRPKWRRPPRWLHPQAAAEAEPSADDGPGGAVRRRHVVGWPEAFARGSRVESQSQ